MPGGDQSGNLLPLERKYTGIGVSELRERQLRDEAGRLKRLVADLNWTSRSGRRPSQKSCKASWASEVGALGAGGLSNQRAARDNNESWGQVRPYRSPTFPGSSLERSQAEASYS